MVKKDIKGMDTMLKDIFSSDFKYVQPKSKTENLTEWIARQKALPGMANFEMLSVREIGHPRCDPFRPSG